MRLHRNILWLVPLCCIVTFPLWSGPVGKFLSPRGEFADQEDQGPPPGHNFNMDTVQILQSQEGRKTAIIRAEKARTADNPDILEMDRVDADIFDDDGNITHVVADRGLYSNITKILTLIDNVVVNKRIDKQFLYTQLLHYDCEKRTVNCPGQTRLEAKDARIDGGSLDYDVQTGTYVIANRVNCLLNGFIAPP